jgi:hypothetical protein
MFNRRGFQIRFRGSMQTMSDLDEVLAQVRNRLTRYRDQSLNEQNTKSSLIDPVLRALGWDTEDFEEVHREYKPKPTDNPVDYALFILRTPRLFLEAKALGGNLNDRRWANQIMGYAAVSGVEWVVLTDGNEYRLYNAHAPVPIEEKLFRSVQFGQSKSTTMGHPQRPHLNSSRRNGCRRISSRSFGGRLSSISRFE